MTSGGVRSRTTTATGGRSDAGSRREFFRDAVAAAAGGAALLEGLPALAAGAAQETPAPSARAALPAAQRANQLERMRAELAQALAKPVAKRRWAMVIDLRRCIGCKACTVSCVAENNLPPGVVYRTILEEEIGEFPNVSKRFTPRPCMHCENPPCTPVCPVGATYSRPDGIVAINYDACIGCRYCIAACPYNARTADFGEYYVEAPETGDAVMAAERAAAYELRPSFEYGREWRREPGSHASPKGNARKCQFCLHRIENGLLPACVTTCLGGATLFGDYGERRSLVHEQVGSSRRMRLKEELGTEPRVFYLV